MSTKFRFAQAKKSEKYPTLSNLLHTVFQWHGDHQRRFMLDVPGDRVAFVHWWLKWGHKQFGLPRSAGLGDETKTELYGYASGRMSYCGVDVPDLVLEATDESDPPDLRIAKFLAFSLKDYELSDFFDFDNPFVRWLTDGVSDKNPLTNALFLISSISNGNKSEFQTDQPSGRVALVFWWLKWGHKQFGLPRSAGLGNKLKSEFYGFSSGSELFGDVKVPELVLKVTDASLPLEQRITQFLAFSFVDYELFDFFDFNTPFVKWLKERVSEANPLSNALYLLCLHLDNKLQLKLNDPGHRVSFVHWYLKWGDQQFGLPRAVCFGDTVKSEVYGYSSGNEIHNGVKIPDLVLESTDDKLTLRERIAGFLQYALVDYQLSDFFEYESEFVYWLKARVSEDNPLSNALYLLTDMHEDLRQLREMSKISELLRWWYQSGHEMYSFRPDCIFDNGILDELYDCNKDYSLYKIFNISSEHSRNQLWNRTESLCSFSKNNDSLSIGDGNRNNKNDLISLNERTINVVGMHDSPIGIGEDARLIADSVEYLGHPVCRVNADPATISQDLKSGRITMWCLPAPNVAIRGFFPEQDVFAQGYNILSCPWELPKWPESLRWIFDCFDEIWVHSDFVYQSIPPRYLNRVKIAPLPVLVTNYNDCNTLNMFGSTKQFRFISPFDFSSFSTRKNPQGAIEAFRQAFGTEANDDDPILVLKTLNADAHPERVDALNDQINFDRRIITVHEELSKAELHCLYASMDCLLSLHRSEGFGRNIAEAMLLKTPVITTGFSGNMQFCNSSNALLCRYRLVDLELNDYFFSSNQYWAEPDIEHAAELMRFIASNQSKGVAQSMVASAFDNISQSFSIDRFAQWVNQQINLIKI